MGDGRRDGQPMLRELADEESWVWEADKGVGLGGWRWRAVLSDRWKCRWEVHLGCADAKYTSQVGDERE